MLRFMHKSLRFESSPEHHRQPVSKSESHKQSNELDNDPLRISARSFEIRPFYPIHARVKSNGSLAYGLRQSNLLQWSSGRMLTSGGAGSGFNSIVCGVDHMVDCGFDCCEGGRRKDWSFDRVEYGGRAGRGKSRIGGLGFLEKRECRRYAVGLSEAEALIDLLAENVVASTDFNIGMEMEIVRPRKIKESKKESFCDECNRKTKSIASGYSWGNLMHDESTGIDGVGSGHVRNEGVSSQKNSKLRKRDGSGSLPGKLRRSELIRTDLVNIARGRRQREDSDEGLESVEDFDNDNYVIEQSSNTEFRSQNDQKNCNIVEEIERRGKKQQEVRQEGTDGRGSLEGNVVVWDRKKSEKKLIKTSLDQSQSTSETAHKHFKASEAYNSSYNKCDDNSRKHFQRIGENSSLISNVRDRGIHSDTTGSNKVSRSRRRYNGESKFEDIHESNAVTNSNQVVLVHSSVRQENASMWTDLTHAIKEHREQDVVRRTSQEHTETTKIQETDDTSKVSNLRHGEQLTFVQSAVQELKEDRRQHISTVTESKSRRKSQKITNISEINQSDIQKTSISNQQSNSSITIGQGGSNGRVSQKRFWHSQNDETNEHIDKREHQRLAQESIYEEPLSGISSEDALGSTARIQNSSNILIQQFVEQAKSELSVSEVQEKEKIKKTTSVSEGSMRQTMVKSDSVGQELKGSPDSSEGFEAKWSSDETWGVTQTSNELPPVIKALEVSPNAGNGSIKRPGRSLWNVTRDNITKETEIRSSFRESASPSNLVKPEREKAVSQQVGSGAISAIDDHDMSGLSLPSGNVGSSSAVQGISSAYEEAKLLSSGPEMSILPTFSTAWMLWIPFPSMRISRSPAIGNTSLGAKDDPTTSESLDLISSPLRLTEASEPEEKEGELTRKFQQSKQVPKDRFEEWEEAFKLETKLLKIDEIFMREALVEAQKSADNWEVPVGAVLVHHGKIIARGCNLVEELRDSTAHAEMICIRSASNALRTWRLAETTLYVTLEQCAMCAGAILQARVTTLVWGAPNKLLGADGSWIRLLPDSVERDNTPELADKPTAPVHPFHPKMNIRRGILAAECAQVMQHFFQLRRQKRRTSLTHLHAFLLHILPLNKDTTCYTGYKQHQDPDSIQINQVVLACPFPWEPKGDMARNMFYCSLSVVFFFLVVTLELYIPPGAAARKLLQDEPDTDDGGQHKIGALGSTSRHAGSATGDNDTLSGSVRLSPPTALTYIVHMKNGSTMTVSVPYPQIDFSFVPPGFPVPNVPIPNVHIPHVRAPPPPAPGFSSDPQSQPSPRTWHWP
ncbi:unnamed protein product [Rhodiola kirilowii]